MKKLIAGFVLFGFLIAQDSYAQDASVYLPSAYDTSIKKNYIRIWEAQRPDSNPNTLRGRPFQDVRQTTQYFDGIGRPLQTVIKQGSMITGGAGYDLVSPAIYDSVGREAYKYLPFAANNTGSNTSLNDGNFKLNPFAQQQYFYSDNNSNSPIKSQGETYYYGKTEFEPSPLNRADRNYAPGNSWVHDGKGTKNKYWFNTATDSVRIWKVTNSGSIGTFGSYSCDSLYHAGELYKQIIADENDKQVIEFKDKLGQLILKKVQLTAAADTGTGKNYTGWLCTYYIYDDLGNLRCVIQPKGVELLAANSWSMSYSSGVILNEQCFRYEYDVKQLMIMKKVPGAEAVYMIYDGRDRLVMTQDAYLRNAQPYQKFLFIQYDDLNRPIRTGTISTTGDWIVHRDYAAVAAAGGNSYPPVEGFTNEIFTETFYDNYDWRAGQGNPLSASRITSYDTYLQAASNTNWPYPQNATEQTTQTRGLVTGTKTKILGTNTYLFSVSFYDEKARVIQVQSQNITTGTDISTIQYGWAGLVLLNITKNEKAITNSQTSVVLTQLTYDSLGRVAKMEKKASNTKVNSGNIPSSWKTIAQNEYDALGQLKKKKLGSAPLDSLTYDYNIRGEMLGMNRSYVKDTTSTANWFGFDLGYDKTSFTVNGSSKSYAAAQYNGNIGGMLWKSNGDDQLRKYDLTYDAVNRLTGADFNQLTNNSFSKAAGIDFSVSGLDYDGNGNILHMNQKGWKVGGSVMIDSLLYTYIANSNKLLNVIDRRNDTATKLGDFRSSTAYMTSLSNNKTTSATDYSYDPNGNLSLDNNKDINTIHYNHLNLPDSIAVTDKGYIKYVYDASGTKLKRITSEGSITATTLYLFANFVNDTLQFLPQEEGRIRYISTDNSLHYDYFIKDHLGNVRMVLTEQKDTAVYPEVKFETGTVASENIYYENVYVGRTTRPGGFYSQGTNGDTVQLIRKNSQSIGVGKLLKVMAKDLVNIKVDYYAANETTDNSNANGLNSVLSALSGLIDNSSVTTAIHGSGSGSTITTDLNNASVFTTFLSGQSGSGGNMPKAYLNILFFDEQFRFVSTSSEIIQVDTKGSGQTITRNGKEAAKNGYAYIYVSNESNNLVYFDNFLVTHERGPLTEETHYYPFGLSMSGISSKALNFGKENKHKFNDGTELESKEFVDGSGLNMYATTYRSLDPQIGRFLQMDPMAEISHNYSPYAYANNNPIFLNDPAGLLSTDSTHPTVLPTLVLAPVKAKKGLDWENGQIMQPRSQIWDFLLGKRQWKGHLATPGHPEFNIWFNYEVDHRGYLTGKMSRITDLTIDAPFGFTPTNFRAVFRLKNFIKGEYDIYKGVKDGLKYFGKARGGIKFRYTAYEIEKYQIEVIEGLNKIPSNAVALGVEQLVIDLNGGAASGLLANKINATVKEIYINEARWWLDHNMPNWESTLKFH
jgi:RHS repeat-associated protein